MSEDDDNHELQRPEGKLLAIAVARSSMSVRKIAASAQLSDTRLRQIINGYQPAGRGQTIEVIAPASTLARICYALDVTPEELASVGRKDAADSLRRMRAADAEADVQTHMSLRDGQAVAEMSEWLKNYDDQVRGRDQAPPPTSMLALFDTKDLLDQIRRRDQISRHRISRLRAQLEELGHEPTMGRTFEVVPIAQVMAEAADDDERTAQEEQDQEHST